MKFSIVHGLLFLQTLCLFACNAENAEKNATLTSKNTSLEAEILNLEKTRIEAMNQLDTIAFKQVASPDYEIINEQGEILNLKTFFQKLVKQKTAQKQEKIYTKSSTIKFFANNTMAISRGKLIIERKESRGVIVFNMLFSDIYVIQNPNKRWTLVHSQLTRVKNQLAY